MSNIARATVYVVATQLLSLGIPGTFFEGIHVDANTIYAPSALLQPKH